MPESWKKDFKKILVHYYLCGHEIEKLMTAGFFKSDEKGADKKTPKSVVAIGRLTGSDFLNSTILVGFSNGKHEVFSIVHKDKLPDTKYIFAMAGVSDSVGEAQARFAIEREIGQLVLGAGRGVALALAASFVFDLASERFTFPSDVASLPNEKDFELFDSCKTIDELKKRIEHHDADIRKRVEAALQTTCHAAIEKKLTEKFLLYWTAIEILTGGKAEGFADKLCSHYQIPQADTENFRTRLRSRDLVDLRNSLIHHGKQIEVSPFGERFLQAIILDLLLSVVNVQSNFAAKYADTNQAAALTHVPNVADVAIALD